ncbi:MAG TPA: type IV pilus twitching motility protein PilT, partial [Gaiellaceae bacterium]|nr:type IV pilus twitching motility protein PilT [Gaiellaceae bacterium]
SDLHLSSAMPPLIRKDGEMCRLYDHEGTLSAEGAMRLLMEITPDKNRKEFEERHDTDFAYEIAGLARFRANVFMDRQGVGAVFRVIPSKILSAETLGLSQHVLNLCSLKKGLVLVTGPTGSGKSTTLCAMIDYVNRMRADHIITIEDPIEFVHQNQKCLINQREIGVDATSFAEALRAALRQDPDVILLGEMRDLETISTALTAAETGHLVFATLHTQDASSTVDRLIDVFPAAQQGQIRTQIAASLQGVVTQALVPTADGTGRVPAVEILFPDDAVRNLIRQAKVEQVYSIMQTGTSRGMMTLEQSLADLVLRGVVDQKMALSRSSRAEQLLGLIQRNSLEPEQQQLAAASGLRVAGA